MIVTHTDRAEPGIYEHPIETAVAFRSYGPVVNKLSGPIWTDRWIQPGSYEEVTGGDPDTTGWGTTEKGRFWYNKTSDLVKYWDGSAIEVYASKTYVDTIVGATTFLGLTDTPGNYTGDSEKLLFVNTAENAVAFASELKWDVSGGYFGINSAAPDAKLTVVDSAFPVARFTRTSIATNTTLGALNIIHKTTGNMADEFGVGMSFSIRDMGLGSPIVIASVNAVRSGSVDNTGSLVFKTDLVGSSSERVRINEEGLLVGGQSDISCGGTKCIVLQDGTDPTASPNNAVVLFSGPEAVASSDYCLNIRNEDGTRLRLQQKPHISDPAGAGDPGVDTPCRFAVTSILSILQAIGFMAAS